LSKEVAGMDAGVRSTATAGLLHALTDAVLVLRADVVVDAPDGADRRLGTGVLTGSALRDLVHPDDTQARGLRPEAFRVVS
jgi:hypothetical protein